MDADKQPGLHSRGSIRWQVSGDHGIEVRMEIEQREEVLFKSLLEHIGGEIGTTYASLKRLLIQEIQDGSGQANSKITNLAATLSTALGVILARRVVSGTCTVCPLEIGYQPE